MGHSAAVYRVRIKVRNRDEYRLFGDFDDAGGSFVEFLQGELSNAKVLSSDGDKSVSCGSAEIDGHELLVVLEHGQRGVGADIIAPDGTRRLRQHPDDTQNLLCGALFDLPLDSTHGWLCVHVNNRRGVKGLLSTYLDARFQQKHPNLLLKITPCTAGSALDEAVQRNAIEKIRLVGIQKAHDRANAATNKWIEASVDAKLALEIQPRTIAGRVIPDRIRRFLAGDRNVFHEIVEFDGLTFDEASVEVDMPDGSRRTFNIEKPEAGHAITVDLSDLELDDGDPTIPSLKRELRSVLTSRHIRRVT